MCSLWRGVWFTRGIPTFCDDCRKFSTVGNGSTQCVLCGDEFGLLGASPTFCDDCLKVSTVGKMDQDSVFSVEMSLVYKGHPLPSVMTAKR